MWRYQLLLLLLSPFILFRVLRFARRYPNYRALEALIGQGKPITAGLWVHCASVGEVIAVKPLIHKWLASHPGDTLLVTTVTPTGEEQVRTAFGDRVVHRYLPIDWNWSVKRALRKIQCANLLIVETELWPNLLQQVSSGGVKVSLINGRLSERSFRRYQRFPWLTNAIFNSLSGVCAHDKEDGERFTILGARDVIVTGNIKFDLTIDRQILTSDWRQKVSPTSYIWIAASTHAGEDEIFLSVQQQLLKRYPEALLLLVPRHPERFDKVYQQAQIVFKDVGRRSITPIEQWSKLQVLVGDSMGELMRYYQLADVAVVAGSFIERGGHNPIEPAVLGKPVLIGPHTFNFLEITEALIRAEGAQRCNTQNELTEQLSDLFENKEKLRALSVNAKRFAASNQGAVDKVLQHLEN